MRIEAVVGDITAEQVDAVVNAANSSLLGGGGVDGAIHRAAGPDLLAECRRLRESTLPAGLPVGHAVSTGAGNMPTRWVIHTVGPNAHAGQTDPALLAACFTSSLDVAEQIGARSLAFPAVSAGVFGWQMATVAQIAVRATQGWDQSHPGSAVELVRFVLIDEPAQAQFREQIAGS